MHFFPLLFKTNPQIDGQMARTKWPLRASQPPAPKFDNPVQPLQLLKKNPRMFQRPIHYYPGQVGLCIVFGVVLLCGVNGLWPMVGSRAVWISMANSIRIDDICRPDVSLELDKLGALHRTKQLSSFRAPTHLLDLSLRGAYSCSDATAATVIMQAGKPESSHVVSTCVRGQPWQRDGAFQPEDISHLLPPVFRPLACYGAPAPFCDKMHRVTSAHGNDASCKANFFKSYCHFKHSRIA